MTYGPEYLEYPEGGWQAREINWAARTTQLRNQTGKAYRDEQNLENSEDNPTPEFGDLGA